MSLSLPVSLYIHIPWCVRKCPYCDFNSHQKQGDLPEKAYVDQLLLDLDQDLLQFPQQQPCHAIFIGGGTPSLFSATAYDRLFTGLRQRMRFEPELEITLEANPGTVEQQRFTDYRALGINRLSLGIQSFNARHLARLGRIHDDQQAHQAIDSAHAAGFERLNLDIMHGLPEQTVAEGLYDLAQALSYQPTHLSWYQLTIEPNTIFYKTQPPLPVEEEACQLEDEGFALLAAHQFHRYEISAFSRAHHQARHNLNYWLFGDYYGIGAGAHGKLTDPSTQQVLRTLKYRLPRDYLSHPQPRASSSVVGTNDLVFEFMLNTTRLQQPIRMSLFNERTGLPLDTLLPNLEKAAEKGLITMDKKYWQVTSLGRRFTNDLQALFLA